MVHRPYINRRRLLVRLLAVGWAACLWTPCLSSAPTRLTPAQSRAFLIRHFVRFTTWPRERFKNRQEPIRIAVVGDAEVFAALQLAMGDEKVTGRDGSQRTVEVLELSGVPDGLACHAVYIARLDRETREAVQRLAGRPVITVGEGDEFIKAGGIIAFEPQERRMTYRYSTPAMLAAGIRLEPEVLQLGTPAAEKEGSP